MYGAQNPKDGEELCFPGAFCLEGHMYLKSRVFVSLPLFPVLPLSPCPLPLFPSLPHFLQRLPGTQASLQKVGAHLYPSPQILNMESTPPPPPVCHFLLTERGTGDRLSGARPSPGAAPGKGWTVAFTLGRKEPPTEQGQGRGLVRELL